MIARKAGRQTIIEADELQRWIRPANGAVAGLRTRRQWPNNLHPWHGPTKGPAEFAALTGQKVLRQ